jgi:hypothetical protein
MSKKAYGIFYGNADEARREAKNLAQDTNSPISIFLVGPNRYVFETYEPEDEEILEFLGAVKPVVFI